MCEHTCTNIPGSYNCSCDTGYILSSNNHSCSGIMKIDLVLTHYCGLDINECNTSNGGCNQTCVNEVGSYHCECGTGYTLNSNNHNCDGKATTITRCMSFFLLYM